MGYKIAVVGATGNVGREMLNTLAERNFPAEEIFALASSRSIGRTVSYGDDDLIVQDAARFDFSQVDIALFSAGGTTSKTLAPKAAEAGCVVIDNSSYWRMEPGVPLIVPEVNGEALAGYAKKNIIANPNCSTIQMVMALKPLHDLQPIKRVIVSTYQAVSGAGRAAMDELFNQTRGIYVNDLPTKEQFTKQIAFNVIPHIDEFMDDGATREEWKMMAETRKILDPDVAVHATCVRVPVFVGHSESINIEFEMPVTVEEARKALKAFPGVSVIDHRQDEGYVTPQEVAGEDNVFISRIRKDPSNPNTLSLWCVSDNLRKGAALNAVQIAEMLVSDYLPKK
ncbi:MULTISPECIES: aspartate-semialdehyde dehydrogenase [unclassified Thalassospira]|jgi:aspartate-semialdehyde dehydrogenase|uniref:aspartate-semialdehyde dehydrogenase n=1 Tax=unclassified Thalassospira TaxID=2648997 RepID=UPI000A1FBE9B|nr:aspartate-semialdehyde dehydrogenase [Thalassospira sp. MCCC 1A01428]OSQ45053.1 aspartate-semialdehyde dehydrogenase [Thalassospira sp. MCCC 1A01428]